MNRIQLRRRQRTRMSFQRKLIITTSCVVMMAGAMFVSLNVSNVQQTLASVQGDYKTVASGNWDDKSVWESYDGKQWNAVDKAPEYISNKIIIQKGTVITVNQELTIANVTVEKAATLKLINKSFHLLKQSGGSEMIVYGTIDMGTGIMDGDGKFTLSDDANMVIGSANGISKTATAGNVQVKGNRYYSKYANYIYRSDVKQLSGNGLPYQVNSLMIDNANGFALESNLNIAATLYLKKGILFTQSSTVTLGKGFASAGSLVKEEGSVKGSFKRWFGQGAMKEVLFPLSDGELYNAIYVSANAEEFSGGTYQISFTEGKLPKNNNDDGANGKVLSMGEKGFYKITAADGLENSNYKLSSSVAVSKTENKSYWTARLAKQQEAAAGNSQSLISDLTVWPNPFEDHFSFKFELPQAVEVTAELVNTNGQVVHHSIINGEVNTNEQQIRPEHELAAGIYFLNLSVDGKVVATKRLVRN